MNDELRQAAERVKQHAEYYLREYVLEENDDSDLRRHLRDQLALSDHYLSTPDQSAEVARLTEENERLTRLMQIGFDDVRVLRWMLDDDRKPANTAFTAGGERSAAYLVEMAEERLRADAERWIDVGFGLSCEGFNGEYNRGDVAFREYEPYLQARSAAIDAARKETT